MSHQHQIRCEWRNYQASLIHPFVHRSSDNLISCPHSLSCRGGLRPPRHTSPRSDEWREVYLWLHGALLLRWRPPAHGRLITHLSAERTLEWSTAPLLGYTNTHKYSHACLHIFIKSNRSLSLPNDTVITVILSTGSCLIGEVEETFNFSLWFWRRASRYEGKVICPGFWDVRDISQTMYCLNLISLCSKHHKQNSVSEICKRWNKMLWLDHSNH